MRESLVRRVSCRPGAEGAPLLEVVPVFVTEEGWVSAGAIRRDWMLLLNGVQGIQGGCSYHVDDF